PTFEATRPMSLTAMVPLDASCPRFAHAEFLRRKYRCIHAPSNDRCSRQSPPTGPRDRLASLGLPHHDAHTPSQGVGLDHDQEPFRSTACNVFLRKCHISSISIFQSVSRVTHPA